MTTRLEPWTDEALPPLPPLEGDPRMVRYVRPAEDSDEMAERRAHFQEHHPRQFRIIDAASGEAMGWMAYWNRVWNDEPGLEIGWAVDPRFEGIDFRDSVFEAISAARSEVASRFLLASPSAENDRANAICRATGFTLVEALELPYAPGQSQTCNVWVHDLATGA